MTDERCDVCGNRYRLLTRTPNGLDLCPGCNKPPNPRAEYCRKCGDWIRVLGQSCEWDGGTCAPMRARNK